MRSPRCLYGPAILAVLLVASPTRSHAAWPHDPTIGNVPLSNFVSNQVYPRMCPDGAGGSFIAWHELRSNYDIYAQHITASGALTWGSAGAAVCSTTGDQANTALCPDGAGGVIIAWHDFRAGNWDIYVQRVNAAGVPQWTASGVPICTAAGNQTNPQIVSDGANGAILTWADNRGGAFDIFAQHVTSTGATLWANNGYVVCSAAGNQNQPVAVPDGAGGVVIAWVDGRTGDFDIYAQRVNSGGSAVWNAGGILVCGEASTQDQVNLIADGVGGTILCWRDGRNGANFDVYAQRVNGSGIAMWSDGGTPVFAGANDQSIPVMASDGSGGMIVTWQNTVSLIPHLYAQRLNSSGLPQWPAAGVAVAGGGASTWQDFQSIAADGSGGAIIGWCDQRNGYMDIYAQRIGSDGALRWVTTGAPVCTANQPQSYPSIVSDGAGGAILSWFDERLGPGIARTYAQRIDKYGELGSPEATITSVRDVPNDQGGRVKVSWSASYKDGDPDYFISAYRLWRSAPQSVAAAIALDGERVTTDSDQAAASGKWLVLPDAAQGYAWELVWTQTAVALPSYSVVTPTTGDSIAGSNPRTAFMIEATSGPFPSSPHWFSAPDSGYSVDDLPPATPAPFTGVPGTGSLVLNWGENAEPDFASYRLYRGVGANFVPGPATLLAAQSSAGYVDVTNQPFCYKLTAVDAHGNESAFAFFAATGATAVGDDDHPATLGLAIPQPNPARSLTNLQFDLPARSVVTLAVYDAGGRMVRTLFRGTHPAGRTRMSWNLRDEHGQAVSSGIYFVRLEAGSRVLTRRVIAMR